MKKAGWLKDGIATPRGIVTAHGEMLKRRKMSEAQINEWNGFEKKTIAPKPEPIAIFLNEDNLFNFSFSFTKLDPEMSQMFPASTNKAPFSFPITSKRYSKLVKNLKLPILNSKPLFLAPGPNS